MALLPLPAQAAAALSENRKEASRILDATLPSEWPAADLLDVLPFQAAALPGDERFGVWVMIERASRSVVGDIGFMGPPDEDGSVEVGYSVIPARRRDGYATEAARAIVAWALDQPDVKAVVAGCDRDNESVRAYPGASRVPADRCANGQIRWCYPGSEA
jgi:ribosomal-protein-alanine N-acetyltransferase